MLGPWQIPLTESRLSVLHMTWQGLQRTGHYLVGVQGSALVPAPFDDDSGLYLFASAIARLLHVSPETGATIVLAGGLMLALGVGLYAWFRLARTWSGKALGTAAYLVFAALTLWLGDNYTIAPTLTLGLVPWLLQAWRRGAAPHGWAVLLAVVGLAIGTGQLIRTGAGVQVLVLAAVLVAVLELPWSRRVLLLVVLAVGVVLPGLALRAELKHRDAYLAGVVPHYQAPTGTHPFWHMVFMGQGFLSNTKGLHYGDETTTDRVRLIDPGARYVSPRYEAVARRLVFDLVRSDPLFVLKTEAAKAGILGFYFLVFANIGILAAIARRKPWRLDLALGAGILAAALPGLLVIPDFRFILGFTTLSALFGLTSLDSALARGWPFAGVVRSPSAGGAAARAAAELAR